MCVRERERERERERDETKFLQLSPGREEWRDVFPDEFGHVSAGNVSNTLHGKHVEQRVPRLHVVAYALDYQLRQLVGGANQN